MSDTILFDSNEVDHLDGLGERPRRLGRNQLLWVDFHRDSPVDPSDVVQAFDLHETTANYLTSPHSGPSSSTTGTTSTSPHTRRERTRKANYTPSSASLARTG